MNSQIQGLVISLLVMQGARKVPTDRPDVLFLIRCTYIFVQLLTFGLYWLAAQRVKKLNDTTVLKYTEPPKGMGSTEPGAPVVTTNRDYDLQQIAKKTPGQLIGIAIMAVMHLKFGYTQPLLIQSIMPIKALLLDDEIVQIHIFGKEATGKLARPFKAGGMMAALQQANEASNDAIVANDTDSTTARITEITEEEEKKIKKEGKKDL